MDEETNQTSGKNSSPTTESEPLIKEADLNVLDVKSNKGDALGSDASAATSMIIDNGSDCEKSNAAIKRSSNTPVLVITKLPKHFSYQKIKEWLDKLCAPTDLRDFKIKDDGTTVRAFFQNAEQMSAAKKILNSECIDGTNICVTDADDSMELDGGPPVKRKREDEEDEGPWGLDMDLWRTDPKGLYGVKPEYLSTLGVNDTLKNWVLVLNFRCGKDELREVMELAGNVVVCSVHNRRSSHNANVMYSHPLEALQAISMLNGQMLYGRPLTVKILKSNGAVLPKGLNTVGPGLAKYGKPLRDIMKHYERFVRGQSCGLNVNLFRTPEEQAAQEAEEVTGDEDGKKRAKIAMENLVSDGIDIKDLIVAIKEIIAEHKEEEKEHLIAELNVSEDDDVRDTNSDEHVVVIRVNRDGNKSRSGSPDSRKRATTNANSKTVLPSLPSSNSSSIPTFPSSNAHSIRSTPSPSTFPRRPSNPVRPIGTPSSQASSYASLRRMTPIQTPVIPAPVPISPGMLSNPCSQIFSPNAPRNPMSVGPSPIFGQSGNMSGASGFVPMSSPISRPMSGGMSGPMSGSMSGSMMSGQMSGQMSSPMGGSSRPMSGSGRLMSGAGGPMPSPNFLMPGPNTHPPFGPTVHPTGGSGATLQFSNLPPSTTFALLSDKLAQIGQLVSIQFTVPGSVVAKYAHRSHAEMCIKQFHKTCLDGNIIDVRFI